MNRLWLLLGMCAVAPAALRSMTIDTVHVSTSEIAALRQSAPVVAPVYLLDGTELRSPGGVDLEAGLNQIPGVKMETRGAGGSRRLQMRGSSLRSPFGVRNVFVVLDGFVLTTADGDSPVEWLDPELLGRVEVMTGPAGAAMGGSYAGALWCTSRSASISLASRMSSLGDGAAGKTSFPLATSWAQHLQLGSLQVGVVRNVQPGYRQQEGNAKWQSDVHWKKTTKRAFDQHVWFGGYAGRWELPGSLDLTTALEDPTASPGAAYDAHVERRRLAVGWSRASHHAPENGIWVLGNLTDKLNPYGTSPFYNGDKSESGSGLSARALHADVIKETDRQRLMWQAHGLLQADRTHLRESEMGGGAERYELASETFKSWCALGLKQVRTNGVIWHAGLAWNGVWRATSGTVQSALPFDETFEAANWLPRAGIQWPVWEQHVAFIELGTGISTPTTFELVDPNTLREYGLLPETGTTLEAGWRWSSGPWMAEVCGYAQAVTQAIAVIPGPTDAPVLANADRLNMKGMDALLQGQIHPEVNFRLWGNVSHYFVESPGFFGTSRMPGTPLHAAGATLKRQHRNQMWGYEIRHRWNDRSPLNSLGTDWAPAHHRLDVAATKTWRALELTVAVLNATDSRYSDWYQVNAFGGKYFNPVAPRRWECTVRWSPNSSIR